MQRPHVLLGTTLLMALTLGLQPAGAGAPASCDDSTIDPDSFSGATITPSTTGRTVVEVRAGRQLFVDGTRCATLPDANTITLIQGVSNGRENVTLVINEPLEVGGQGGVRFRVLLSSNEQFPDRFTVKGLDDRGEVFITSQFGVAIRALNSDGGGTIGDVTIDTASAPQLRLTVDGRGGNDILDGRKEVIGDLSTPEPFPGMQTFKGSKGNDRFYGSPLPDVMIGGVGNDHFVTRQGGKDKVNGGQGTDRCKCDAVDVVRNVE